MRPRAAHLRGAERQNFVAFLKNNSVVVTIIIIGHHHFTVTARTYIEKMIHPEILESDVANCRELPPRFPDVDLYAAGFPCQPFSLAGSMCGVQDQRGQVVKDILYQIARNRPKAYILENVKGLLSFEKVFNAILSSLRGIPGISAEHQYVFGCFF